MNIRWTTFPFIAVSFYKCIIWRAIYFQHLFLWFWNQFSKCCSYSPGVIASNSSNLLIIIFTAAGGSARELLWELHWRTCSCHSPSFNELPHFSTASDQRYKTAHYAKRRPELSIGCSIGYWWNFTQYKLLIDIFVVQYS